MLTFHLVPFYKVSWVRNLDEKYLGRDDTKRHFSICECLLNVVQKKLLFTKSYTLFCEIRIKSWFDMIQK